MLDLLFDSVAVITLLFLYAIFHWPELRASRTATQERIRGAILKHPDNMTPYTGPIYNRHGREIG